MGVDKPNVRTVVHASVPAVARGLLPGGRPRGARRRTRRVRCCWPRTATRRCTCTSSSATSSTPDLPRLARATALAAAADGDGRYDARRARARRATLGGDGDRLRALLGHLTRAGRDRARAVGAATASPGRIVGAVRRPRRGALPLVDGGGRRGRAGASTARSGPTSRATRCRRAAILRHFGDRSAPARGRRRAATSATRASCPAPPPPDAGGDRGPRRRDHLGGRARARPAVGRTTCAEILHGARRRRSSATPTTGCPPTATSSHMRRADILARVDELIEAGRLATTGGPYPVLQAAARRDRRVSFRDRRPGLGRGLEPPGAPRHGARARRRRGRGRGVEPRRGARARAGARRAGVETGGVRDARTTPTASARDGALGDWLEAREVELVVLAGFMELLGAGLHPPLRGPDRQRPSRRCCRPSAGIRRDRAGARVRRARSWASRSTSWTRAWTAGRSSCRRRSSFPYPARHRRDRGARPRDRAPAAAACRAADRARGACASTRTTRARC